MQRFRFPSILAPQRVRLMVAACLALGCGSAGAQTAAPAPYADPLAPKLQSDPRNPPRFQKPVPRPLTLLAAPTRFAPPASGADRTGFDSSNSRRAQPSRKPKPGTPAEAQAIAPGSPRPASDSPYQKPAPAVPAAPAPGAAYAQATGLVPPQIGPIRRPLPKRKAFELEDPYAPIGIRAGAFDYFPAIELTAGHNTNPEQSADPKGASFFIIAPELLTRSNWSRHELKVDLRGSYTAYSPDDTPSLNRPFFNGRVDGRIDVTRNTLIDLNARALVTTDNPNNPNLQSGLAVLPLFITYGGGAGLRQRFNRFELTVKGDAQRTAYQDSQLLNGMTASNADRNYDQYGGSLRGSYELTPGVKPFLELGADTRIHDLPVDFFGYRRDSKGGTGSMGTTFEITRLLTGDISFGYMRRDYQDPRLDYIGGVIGNGSLLWSADALNTVKLTVSSTIGESTLPGVPGTLTRDIGLQYDHAFRRWLIGTAKFGFGTDVYKNGAVESSGGTVTICNCVPVFVPGETVIDRIDNRYSLGIGLTYKIDRSAQVKGEVRQDWLISNVRGADYSATTFLLGMRVQK